MLFPAFVQSHVLKWIVTVSSFVFVSLLLINPWLYSFTQDDYNVSADFLYNNDETTDDSIIDPSNVAVAASADTDYKKPLFSYVLKAGDTLSTLASSYGVSVSQLKTFNNIIDETTLRQGKTIYISQTPGFVYVVDTMPISLMVLANMYNFSDKEREELQRVNGEYDDMRPFQPGEAIIIPNKTLAQGYSMGLIKEPVKPVPPVVKPSATRTAVAKAKTTPPRVGAVVAGWAGSSVLKSRRYSFKENNGMTAGYCTYYAAHKARWLFPQIKGNQYFRWVKGNANKWLASAQANGLKTSKTPSVGAVVVFQYGGSRNPWAGHVAIVIGVDTQNKTITVEEMNYVGFGVVNQRRIAMSDDMTQAYDRQKVMWFIPVQPLSAKLEAEYKKQIGK